MLENTFNVAFRVMFDLPRETHKYLVEPVSESVHLKKILVKRFLKFTKAVKLSEKFALTLIYAGGGPQGPPYHTFAHSAQNNIFVNPGTS